MIILLFISKYVSNFLEQKFRQYKQELSKKQTILHQQSKMASMGEMIGNIAHQWRQPLSTITTAATGMKLQKEFGEFNDEIFYDSVDKINASAQHLSKTIDDFRNFFSPNKTKTQFDLKNTFSTALDLISAQFNAKEIKIIKHIENIQLNTYENELIQALINILNNARDELIKLPNSIERLIFIDTYIEDGNVIIEIKDSAGGVPSDIIDRIFEPYFTTKHKSNGTGIGLYMTEEILVKHLKADIEVYNQEYKYNDKFYKGAVFKITIPQ
jgi:signal transduction histidine kinase